MIKFLQKLKFKNALKEYLYDLGPALQKRYGQPEQYTVMQIKKTAKSLKLNMKYIPYAIAMYRHQESENTINYYRIDQDLLNELRSEISLSLFGYYTNYRAVDVIRHSKPLAWQEDNHYTNLPKSAAGHNGSY